MTDQVLDELLRPYRDQIFYLGHVYGSRPKLPLRFKHFDKGPDGAGEAYHVGIFGKTGSGKSVLAKMILLAYARYPQMALLVIEQANVHPCYANLTCITGGTMGTVRKTVTLTNQQERWIKMRTAAGDFTSDSEYIRESIRRDQEESIKFQALKSAIEEGLDSGVSDKTVPQIMEEVEARLRADCRL